MKAISTARHVARLLLHGGDRVAHRVRRRQVQRSLAELGWPRSVLLVCHGNICRSPYAAASLKRFLPADVQDFVDVTSGGFIGPNRHSPTEALRSAAKRGIDLNSHVSRLLSRESIKDIELVVVMNSAQRRAVIELFGVNSKRVVVLGDLDPEPIERRSIRDPIGQNEDVFDESYARIDRCLSKLVSALVNSELERERQLLKD